MSVADVAGVLSRYFVVGFLLPSFFALAALSQLLSQPAFPDAYREASSTSQLAIVGAVSLALALLLSGVHHQLIRLHEGYPLLRYLSPLGGALAARHRRRYTRLEERKDAPRGTPGRTEAARELDESYPARASSVLPTRLGNVIRAFEDHSRRRYNLAGVLIWPRIELLMSADEREPLTDERTTFSFFVNSASLSPVTGGLLLADVLSQEHSSAREEVLLAVATVAAAGVAWLFFYLWSIDAARGWGAGVRAAVDLHRLELYDRLGARRPADPGEELAIGAAIDQLLRFGTPLPRDLRSDPDAKPKEEI